MQQQQQHTRHTAAELSYGMDIHTRNVWSVRYINNAAWGMIHGRMMDIIYENDTIILIFILIFTAAAEEAEEPAACCFFVFRWCGCIYLVISETDTHWLVFFTIYSFKDRQSSSFSSIRPPSRLRPACAILFWSSLQYAVCNVYIVCIRRTLVLFLSLSWYTHTLTFTRNHPPPTPHTYPQWIPEGATPCGHKLTNWVW